MEKSHALRDDLWQLDELMMDTAPVQAAAVRQPSVIMICYGGEMP